MGAASPFTSVLICLFSHWKLHFYFASQVPFLPSFSNPSLFFSCLSFLLNAEYQKPTQFKNSIAHIFHYWSKFMSISFFFFFSTKGPASFG